MRVCNCSMFCCALLCVRPSIAIILMGKRELVALLNLSSWCLVMVVWLFLTMPRVCLQFVTVVFPDHTHILFYYILCAKFVEIFSWTPRPCSTLITFVWNGYLQACAFDLNVSYWLPTNWSLFQLCYNFSMVSYHKSVGPLTSRCSFPTARRSGVRPRISLKSTFRCGFSSSILWTVGISPNSAA